MCRAAAERETENNVGCLQSIINTETDSTRRWSFRRYVRIFGHQKKCCTHIQFQYSRQRPWQRVRNQFIRSKVTVPHPLVLQNIQLKVTSIHSFKDDFEPFVKNCSCLACEKHTRGYTHHLCNTKELQGSILLMMYDFNDIQNITRI